MEYLFSMHLNFSPMSTYCKTTIKVKYNFDRRYRKEEGRSWWFIVNSRNCYSRNLNSIPGISRIFGKSESFLETFPGKFRTVCCHSKISGMKTYLVRAWVKVAKQLMAPWWRNEVKIMLIVREILYFPKFWKLYLAKYGSVKKLVKKSQSVEINQRRHEMI